MKEKDNGGLGGNSNMDNGIKFLNSKGGGSLQRFMERGPGPQYVEGLGEEEEEKVVAFKGKLKLGYEESEAELRRKAYLEEIQNQPPVYIAPRIPEEEKPRFTNSKGTKNVGLFMQEKPQPSTNEPENPEKRTFTNSKKLKDIQPVEIEKTQG